VPNGAQIENRESGPFEQGRLPIAFVTSAVSSVLYSPRPYRTPVFFNYFQVIADHLGMLLATSRQADLGSGHAVRAAARFLQK
jgi:hypothetical protein